jgi:hypothetical protein
VGIGNNSIAANYKLSVNGAGNFYNGVSGLGRVFLGDPVDSSGYIGLYRSVLGPSNSTTAGNGLNFAAIDGYTFNTGAVAFGSQTERMRIDSSGNLGIGTAAPGQTLHLKSETSANVQFEDTTSGTAGYVGPSENNQSDTTAQRLGIRGEAGVSFSVGAATKMTLDASGNLLVGATSASGSGGLAKLTLDGARECAVL